MNTNHKKTDDVKLSPRAVEFLQTYIRHKLMVQSRTDRTCWYMVDIAAKTCECEHHRKTKAECFHIEQAIKFRLHQLRTKAEQAQSKCPSCGSIKTVYEGDRERCADCGR